LLLNRFETDSDGESSSRSDDVISIHDDDSDPELTEEPASKVRKVSAEEESEPKDEQKSGVENRDWQSMMHDIRLPTADTDNPEEMYAQCPQIKDIPCLTVDLHPGELLYLPASWFYEVGKRSVKAAESVHRNLISAQLVALFFFYICYYYCWLMIQKNEVCTMLALQCRLFTEPHHRVTVPSTRMNSYSYFVDCCQEVKRRVSCLFCDSHIRLHCRAKIASAVTTEAALLCLTDDIQGARHISIYGFMKSK
jgi:Cupin-like domain